jgi:RNA recognition motif-containing protein
MNIYVGNLSSEITEEELRLEFIMFGKVTSVTLMNDLDIGSGQGRHCGYIEMPSIQEGESAIEQLQGKSIKGHQLDIIKALPLTRNYDTDNNDETKVSGFSRKNRYWGGKWRRC